MPCSQSYQQNSQDFLVLSVVLKGLKGLDSGLVGRHASRELRLQCATGNTWVLLCGISCKVVKVLLSIVQYSTQLQYCRRDTHANVHVSVYT